MEYALDLQQINGSDAPIAGSKATSIARLTRVGARAPAGACVLTHAYKAYVDSTGLSERIRMELSRKDFDQMRWEEVWDTSLRIRNMFLTTPMPPRIAASLKPFIHARFSGKPTAVRSSAPGEDTGGSSFAGLHESYVNVRGTDEILEKIRLVWASLWSDAALLYRVELGLDVASSAMAVVVQEMVLGERSGVAFCLNPNDPSQAVIESVHGLNAGLVDGVCEPDRWSTDRDTGRILSHTPANRTKWVTPTAFGTALVDLPDDLVGKPPLIVEEVGQVLELAMNCERLFGAPQDVEWTFRGDELFVLQSRPITTVSNDGSQGGRAWYLTLRRSFDNLKALRKRIENELIPQMEKSAKELARLDPAGLSDESLADEIERRSREFEKWSQIYYSEFIPFAHGMRLFGQVYNDTLRPEDPYQFMSLLESGKMISLARNEALDGMASIIRADDNLARRLVEEGESALPPELAGMIDEFTTKFGELVCAGSTCTVGRDGVLKVLIQMASRPPAKRMPRSGEAEKLREEFLSRLEGDEAQFATDLLDLARASYRLRDDDNVYLNRIEQPLLKAVEEAKSRRGLTSEAHFTPVELVRAMREPGYQPIPLTEKAKTRFERGTMLYRQIMAQPAGPGIAKGLARVIKSASDLLDFKAGDVLVCDAVEPEMTFVVPLCCAIVERRGGMLIHGAIIAREYGLPCVTGVPDATSIILNGDRLTVDGYLGIVTIEAGPEEGTPPSDREE